MNILFITHYTSLYGANRSLLNLIDGLVPMGVNPFVVVPHEGDITSALRERDIPYLVTPHKWWSSLVVTSDGASGKIMQYIEQRTAAFRRLAINLRLVPRIAKQLKTWDIDIVYSNSSVIPLGAMIAWWMKKPHVWHLREFGTYDYQLTFDWGASVSNYFLRKAEAQICVSEAICSHYFNGTENKKCHIIYNGVATSVEMDCYYSAGYARSNIEGTYVFALVGLIHPGKGQDVAIRALGLLRGSFPNIRLIIVGTGDKRDLEDLARNCGVSDQITFQGYVNNPYDIYMQADAVLMCSKNEAMGRVTVEAMAAGRPVIGYNGGGTSELVIHEVTGLLYEGGEQELAFCMGSLANNPAWARKMGKRGWELAKEKFTTEIYAKNIYKVLFDLVN